MAYSLFFVGKRASWGGLALAATLTTACGDFAFGDGGPEGNGDDDGDDAFGEGGETEGAGADDAGATGGDGNGDSGGAEPDCGDYFCEGVGTCVEAEGDFFCECGEGFLPQGKTCVECEPADEGQLDIDVAVVSLSGALRIGGEVTQTSIFDRGRVVAVNTRTGDLVPIASTRNGAFDVGLVAGVYDLYYELEAGGFNVPRNEHAFLRSISLFEDRSDFFIELDGVRVEGEITINGVPPTTSMLDRGAIFFEDPSTGDRASLGETPSGSYSALVLPGTFEVYYALVTGGINVPRNEHGRVQTGVVIDAPETPGGVVTHDVDIPVRSFSGAITVGGAAPSSSALDNGQISLRSPDGRDRVPLGLTNQGSFDASVIPGEYQLEYGLENGGVSVPRNRAARIGAVSLNTDLVQVVDVPTTTVQGAFTLNGGPPSNSAFDTGRVWLRALDGGEDEALLGLTSQGSFSALVVPGTYEIRYGVESAGSTVPQNTDALLEVADLATNPQRDVNIPVVTVDGGITIAGAPPPTSIYQSARLVLQSSDRRDRLTLGRTHEGIYEARVIPGSYDLRFEEDGATELPGNRNGDVLSALAIPADMSIPVDVPVVDMAGQVTVGGATPPAAADDAGRIYLERRSENDAVFVTSTTDPVYTTEVLPGTYDVYYRVDQSAGGVVPSNESARLTCVRIGKPE